MKKGDAGGKTPKGRPVDRDSTGKPPCPKCANDTSRVINCGILRVPQPEGHPDSFPRQRKCKSCGYVWVTFEQNVLGKPQHVV